MLGSSIPFLMGPASAAGSSYIRVNQVGYLSEGPKAATLMSSEPLGGSTFEVRGESDSIAFSGTVGNRRKDWSTSYPYVYRLGFSDLRSSGSYRIVVDATTSPPFNIGGPELFTQLFSDSIDFYRAQRDGPDVDAALLGREPSHLEDAQATIYRSPTYRDGVLQGTLRKIGGPIDASGGWADAGDYGKFVETASYVDLLLLMALRDGAGTATTELDAEARFGLEWLGKMWSEEKGVLYHQVGLPEGNEQIRADHDYWRLPEADSELAVERGDAEYFVKFRPVFRANDPGEKVSPNLAGRLAAAFGLCAQVYREPDPELADACLVEAQGVFARAKKRDVGRLVTISPFSGYPESEWRDDLELGAVEIALAMHGQSTVPAGAINDSADFYLRAALRWGNAYLDRENGDTLSVYDVGGVAHPELVTALRTFGAPLDEQEPFLNELEGKLEASEQRSALEPFSLGTYYYGYDQVPRALGVAVEALLYDDLTGTTRFEELAWDQIGWSLGANPWGTSFIVGAGSTFPHCLHHQIANLNGALDGSMPLLRGVTVPGPNRVSEFKGLGVSDEMRRCPVGGGDAFSQFGGQGIRYMDNVKSWPTVEPAIDYSIATTILFGMLSRAQ